MLHNFMMTQNKTMISNGVITKYSIVAVAYLNRHLVYKEDVLFHIVILCNKN